MFDTTIYIFVHDVLAHVGNVVLVVQTAFSLTVTGEKSEQDGAREREIQQVSSVRRLCQPTLSNETWHLSCSREGGIEKQGSEEGTKGGSKG